jgi:MFS family permease
MARQVRKADAISQANGRLASAARRRVIAPLLVAVFMRALPLTMVGPLLPSIARSLGAGLAEVGWIVATYATGSLIAQPLMGGLSDSRGRRNVLLWCIILFGAGSMVCALSTSLWVLIGGRTVQALGAGGIAPVATAIIGDRLPERERGGALGAIYGMFGLGTMAGALLGGSLVDGSLWLAAHVNVWSALRAELTSFPWHVVFWVNVAIAGAAVASALLLPPDALEKSKSSQPRGLEMRSRTVRFDPLIFEGFGPKLIYAIAFLFGIPSFSLTIYSATYFIAQFDATATQGGMALFVLAVLYVIGAIAGGQAVRVFGEKLPLFAGLGLAAAALVTLAFVAQMTEVVVAMAAGGFGLGLTSAPPNALMLRYFDARRSGAATGLMTMLATSGAITAPGVVWAWLHFGRGSAAENLRGEFFCGAALAAICAVLACALPRERTSPSFEP